MFPSLSPATSLTFEGGHGALCAGKKNLSEGDREVFARGPYEEEQALERHRGRDVPRGVHRVDERDGLGELLALMARQLDVLAPLPLRRGLEDGAECAEPHDQELAQIARESLDLGLGAIAPDALHEAFQQTHLVRLALAQVLLHEPGVERGPVDRAHLAPRVPDLEARHQVHLEALEIPSHVGVLGVVLPASEHAPADREALLLQRLERCALREQHEQVYVRVPQMGPLGHRPHKHQLDMRVQTPGLAGHEGFELVDRIQDLRVLRPGRLDLLENGILDGHRIHGLGPEVINAGARKSPEKRATNIGVAPRTQ